MNVKTVNYDLSQDIRDVNVAQNENESRWIWLSEDGCNGKLVL